MSDKEVEVIIKRFGKIEGKHKMDSIDEFEPIFEEEKKKDRWKHKPLEWI